MTSRSRSPSSGRLSSMVLPCDLGPQCYRASHTRPKFAMSILPGIAPSPRLARLDRHALVLQQPALAPQPAAVFYQRAVGADQAVTGHDHADRIRAVSVADGANGFGHFELRGERAVAQRRASRNPG